MLIVPDTVAIPFGCGTGSKHEQRQYGCEKIQNSPFHDLFLSTVNVYGNSKEGSVKFLHEGDIKINNSADSHRKPPLFPGFRAKTEFHLICCGNFILLYIYTSNQNQPA